MILLVISFVSRAVVSFFLCFAKRERKMNTTNTDEATDLRSEDSGADSNKNPAADGLPGTVGMNNSPVKEEYAQDLFVARAPEHADLTPPPVEAEVEAKARASSRTNSADIAQKMSEGMGGDRMSGISGRDVEEDEQKKGKKFAAETSASAQAKQQQAPPSESSTPERDKASKSRMPTHPTSPARRSKNALVESLSDRQSSFQMQLPPKPGTGSGTAAATFARRNGSTNSNSSARPSVGMASSYSRDTSGINSSNRSSNRRSENGRMIGQVPAAAAAAAAAQPQRAGEWLRLRPRAQRQTMLSDAYMQHSEAYHVSSDNMSPPPPHHQYGGQQQGSAYLAHGGRAFDPRQILFPANTVPEQLANAAHLRIEDSHHNTVERPVWRSVGPEAQQQYAMHGEDLIGDGDDQSRSSDDSSSIDEERPQQKQHPRLKKRANKASDSARALEEDNEAARALEAAVREGAKRAETATDDERAPTPQADRSVVPVATDADGAIVEGALDPRQQFMNITPLGASVSPFASDSVSAITDTLSALTAQLDTDTENEPSEAGGAQMTLEQRQQYRAMLYAQHYAALAAQAQAQAQEQAQAQAQAQGQSDLQGMQQHPTGSYAVHPQAQALGMSAATVQLQQQQLYALENPDVGQMMAYQQAQAAYLAQQAQYAEWIVQQHHRQQLIAQQQQQQMQQMQAQDGVDLQQQEQQQQIGTTAADQHEGVDDEMTGPQHEVAVDAVPTPPPMTSLNRNVSGSKRSVVSSAAFSAQPTVHARGGRDIAFEDGIEEEGDSSSENNYEEGDKIQTDGSPYRRQSQSDDELSPYPSHESELYEMQSAGAYHLASPDSKYEVYACRVDVAQGDRSTEISLFSAARPHMRGFHFSWSGFFCAFLAWFAIAPLLPEIQRTLNLSREQLWNSSICSVAAGVVFRVIAGPLSDKYGARWIMGIFLVAAGLPCMCTGLVESAAGLSVLRTIIGIGGATFVPMQYWTSSMFTKEVAGTANSLAAGWGNLGGGITQILIGSILLPLFKVIYGETDPSEPAEKSWRTVCVVPGFICCVLAFCLVRYSDDCPKGNYRKRKRLGLMPSVSAGKSLQAASRDRNTWLLIFQYACCFGVELTMSNAAVLYFTVQFGQSIESASAIASIFGWMNLFARG